MLKLSKSATPEISRRKFIANTGAAITSTLLASLPLVSSAAHPAGITVGQIMDAFIARVKGAPFPATVDTLKSGNRDTLVTAVVTSMFATIDVIKNAIALNANFIIVHEPTFYNHQDATQWLENDEVYKYKADLLKQHNIAVWRNHDYIHSIHPDGVRKALVDELGWNSYGDPDQPVYNLPFALPLSSLISGIKTKLNIPAVRYVGRLNQPCKKILLMPGAAGGTSHITGINKYAPDVLVCGEVAEWETAEYVRDANAKGQQLSLIVLGHIASEEAGSKFMLGWVKLNFPSLPAAFIPAGNSLSFM